MVSFVPCTRPTDDILPVGQILRGAQNLGQELLDGLYLIL